MSPRAARHAAGAAAQPYAWPAADHTLPAAAPLVYGPPMGDAGDARAFEAGGEGGRSADQLALIERDAFVKGFAQGERSGAEAAARQAETMLRRLAETINEVASLRGDLMRRTERELVRLAVAVAERIVRREISLDHELLVAMAHVAIARLGERVSAAIHLNPADHAAIAGASSAAPMPGVEIVADPMVSRGGCLVRSDFGLMDLSIESQIAEMTRALLGSDGQMDGEAVGNAGLSDV